VLATTTTADMSTSTEETDDDDDQTTGRPNSGPAGLELVQGVVVPMCRENWFLDASATKCYFVAPLFDSGSFFETTEFCESLGGGLVQPSTQEEFNAVNDIVHNITNWTQGPWMGLIRPFGDTRVVQASTGMSLPDSDFAAVLAAQINASDPNSNCAGYSAVADAQLDFYSCNMQGNPFCEMPALYEFFPVNMTDFSGDSQATTTDSDDSDSDVSTSATIVATDDGSGDDK